MARSRLGQLAPAGAMRFPHFSRPVESYLRTTVAHVDESTWLEQLA